MNNSDDYISEDFQVNPGQKLEPLEMKVLKQLAEGRSPAHIQRELTLRPVELTQVKASLLQKLRAKTIGELINRAWIVGSITSRFLSVMVICGLLLQLSPDHYRPTQRPAQRLNQRTVSGLRIRAASA